MRDGIADSKSATNSIELYCVSNGVAAKCTSRIDLLAAQCRRRTL
jgi:hypothetical protein